MSSHSSGCERFLGDAKKLDYFSPPRLHGPEAGGVHVLDFGCSSTPFTRDFLLQDFSPARHFDSGLTTVSCPSSSFSPPDNEFIQFSHSRHSVFDYATRHTTISFVDAHCAVFSSGQFNCAGLRIPVPSRLNIPVWGALLQDYEDSIICNLLEFGWPLGYTSQTLPLFDLRTHRGAFNFPSAVQDYLSSEISLGRVAGPFDAPPFPDGFVVSPLNTVAKRESQEQRVIVDLSWPCGSSVNDGIPSGSFLGELLDLTYPTIDAIVSAIVSLGRGCMVYKHDLRKAYHQFPVDPHDYHLLGYTWNSQFYFDTVLTMGLRSAAMACQRSTSAVTWILNRRGLRIFNYLDDFIGVS